MHHRVALGVALAALLAAGARADDKSGCASAALGGGRVESVIDGRAVRLADGREVRLAGIEVPESARATLEALVSGREISLLRLGPDSDRYGRVVALVAVQTGQSVQQALLAQGRARPGPRPRSGTRAALPPFWAQKARPAAPDLAFGPTRIM